MVLLHEHLGLDPHVYEVHVAIDNAAAGHGGKAKRAVELHLEHLRTRFGEDAGCPIRSDDQDGVRPLTLLSPAERVDAHPTGKIHGTGSVH
jgi:hypothetical protein